MIWWQQWGDKLDALQALADRGQNVPALDAAPQFRLELEVFMRCYSDVSADRSFNGQITFRAVSQWCQLYGVPIAECWEILHSADGQVTAWQSSRSKSSARPKT